jgi:hypothetical protein
VGALDVVDGSGSLLTGFDVLIGKITRFREYADLDGPLR